MRERNWGWCVFCLLLRLRQSGVAPANQTKERGKTKSSWISPPFFCEFWCFFLGKTSTKLTYWTFVPECPCEKFMNWPFFGLVCRGHSWDNWHTTPSRSPKQACLLPFYLVLQGWLILTDSCGRALSSSVFRVGFWQNGFFVDFYFWAAGFFRGFFAGYNSAACSVEKQRLGASGVQNDARKSHQTSFSAG